MKFAQRKLDKLAQFDSPTISNVIELFEVVPRNAGYMNGHIKCNFPNMSPMVGFASTASFRSSAPPAGGGGYGSLKDQLETFAELPGPPVVVFQDLDDPPVGATFGEVMCSTYKGFGSVGLITSGGGRDLSQVEQLGFPVFTGSTIVSHGYNHMLHIGQPVHVGGLVVQQGDLLHGDENGVTRIPMEIASEVAEVAEEFVAAESIVMDYVKGSDEKTIQRFTAAQSEFRAAVEKLKKRVRRERA